jgi:hypothetical protein
MNDEARHYCSISHEYAAHTSVALARSEYVNKDYNNLHTNTIEGFYSIFKRGMKRVCQHCQKKHINRYLAEFDFRYSNRVALKVNVDSRADIFYTASQVGGYHIKGLMCDARKKHFECQEEQSKRFQETVRAQTVAGELNPIAAYETMEKIIASGAEAPLESSDSSVLG